MAHNIVDLLNAVRPPLTADELVRAIHREERRAARQRLEASESRSFLVGELVRVAGSQAAAAGLLGTSRQAVSKATAAPSPDDPDLDTARYDAEPPLTYLLESWGRYGADAITVEEWKMLEGGAARDAAQHAADIWDTLGRFAQMFVTTMQRSRERLQDLADATPEQIAEQYSQKAVQQRGHRDALYPHLIPQDSAEARRMFLLASEMDGPFSGLGEAAFRQAQEWRARASQNG